MKSLTCNYSIYSKNLDLIKVKNYPCKLDRYSVYLDPTYGHIVTDNLNIKEDDNLRNFMTLDSEYILDFNYIRKKIINSFEEDISILILILAYKYVWLIEEFFF